MRTQNDHYLDILLAAHAGLIPELAPPDVMKKRMLADIVQRTRTRTPSMQVVRKNEGQWRELLPGVEIKVLQENTDEQSQTTLWRLQPGASVPRHQHHQNEECLILEGSIIHDGTEYFAGDYLLSPVGMLHDHFVAPRGALFLIRGEIIDKSMLL